MKETKTLLILSILTLFICFSASNPVFAKNFINKNFLVNQGLYYRSYINHKNIPKTGTVLCVNEQNLKSRLTSGKLKFEFEYIAAGDYGAEILGCKPGERPVFYAGNNSDIPKSGAARTVYLSSGYDTNSPVMKIKFGNETYYLKLSIARTNPYDKISPKYIVNITLSNSKKAQTIVRKVVRSSTDYPGWFNLDWAGDIDRDGRLDLLIDYPDAPNSEVFTLFLSSHAGRNNLVRPAARVISAYP